MNRRKRRGGGLSGRMGGERTSGYGGERRRRGRVSRRRRRLDTRSQSRLCSWLIRRRVIEILTGGVSARLLNRSLKLVQRSDNLVLRPKLNQLLCDSGSSRVGVSRKNESSELRVRVERRAAKSGMLANDHECGSDGCIKR